MIGLTPEHLRIVQAVFKKHVPGFVVWAFGSRVTGKAGPYSDLDVVVVSEEPLDLGLLGRIRDALSESELPFVVDVIDWTMVSDEFRELIKRSHETLWAGEQGLGE